MGFLIVCAAVAVILIARRINTWSNARPDRRYIVVNTPEGGRKVIPSAPATTLREGQAPAQGRPQAQPEAEPPAQPEAEPPAQPEAEPPAQPEAEPHAQALGQPEQTAPQPPLQQPGNPWLGVDAEPAVQSPEPPSPLDMLSPKIAQVPPELAAQVVALMNKRREVSAVRLLCDELRIGILDAQRTARSLVGR